MANQTTDPQIISIDIRPNPGQEGRHVEGQTPAELQKISTADIEVLNRDEFIAMTLEQLRSLTPQQVAAIDPGQLSAFDDSEISALSPSQIASLTDQQIAGLTVDQIGALTIPQIVALNRSGKLANFSPEQIARLRRRSSELAILDLCAAVEPRPHPYSLWSEKVGTMETAGYASWPSLTDRTFFGRHLPNATDKFMRALPEDRPYQGPRDYGDVTALFKRDAFTPSRSSLLFSYFAQWFTDSFLRTNMDDRRKNSSNHHIDMCQIYGLDETTSDILRSKVNGKLKVEPGMDKEFPPRLFEEGGAVKKEFEGLPYVRNGGYKVFLEKVGDTEARRANYFATGLERGNSNVGYSALNTLFLRDHNRICDRLRKKNPTWNDERLFQTARMIVILKEIKIVVEEYINHISAPPDGQRIFVFDNTFAEKQSWYRLNWIKAEFDLLYRWHSLVPDTIKVGRRTYNPMQFLINNDPLLDNGVGDVLRSSTRQVAGKIGLFNSPDFLLGPEALAIKMARDCKLRSYNEYCAHFGLPPKKSINELTTDRRTRARLTSLYKTIDNVEFLTGIYAEDPAPGKLFGNLMTVMVGCDAFSQALTNPLLSVNIFGKQTLTDVGMDELERTRCLDDVLIANEQGKASKPATVIKLSMDHKNSPPRRALL